MDWWYWLGVILLLGCALFLFNYWQGTVVMYRVIARSYFGARRQGYSHQQAIKWMVESRHNDPDRRKALLQEIELGHIARDEEEMIEGDGDLVVWAIFVIHCMEHGIRPPDSHRAMASIELEVRKVALAEKFKEEGFWRD